MEALSGVASGMAVVSLTIQLVESVSKIRALIRTIKGAPAELERLAKLLTRLAAVLEDVSHSLEQQSSLQTQLECLPAASPAVIVCLQSCENTIKPLEDFLQKFRRTHNGSTLTQLPKDIRIALKTKDIAALETRIHHDITSLHMALGTNTTNILLDVLPALLKNQQQNGALTSSSEPPPLAVTESSNVEDNFFTHETNPYPGPSHPRFFRRMTEMDSPLRKFGMRQRKTIRYICFPQHQRGQAFSNHDKEIISEENEYIIGWKFLGFGVRWSCNQACGGILPSLRVYSVVERFPYKVHDSFSGNDLRSIQKMFSSGELHPFTVLERSGASLLHLAAFYRRPDVYRLLLDYGVKPDVTKLGRAPILYTMINYVGSCNGSTKSIDMYRIMIADLGHIENFQCDTWLYAPYHSDGVQDKLWLWNQSQHFLVGQELLDFQVILVRSILTYIVREQSQEKRNATFQTWAKLIHKELLHEIESGRFQLFRSLWQSYLGRWSMDSHVEGLALIGLLSELGIDAHTCITREHDALEDGILKENSGRFPDKKIIFGRSEGGGFTLRWEWTYERYEPAVSMYTLLSQYEVIATTFGILSWPFSENGREYHHLPLQESPVRDSRFQRRTAAKARKERARAGKKQPRSKMPGAWFFG